MKKRTIFTFFAIILLVSVNTAELLPENEAAAAQVQVINLSIDPAVLMPYDMATVTITLANTGTKSVAISSAQLLSKEFKVLSDPYGKVGAIGAGNSMSFTYTIQAGGASGIFYPVFSVDYRDANFLRYPFRVLVQENPLEVSVLNKPETFVTGKKEDITIHIGNPRDNQVTGVTVIPQTGEHEITPTSYFSGVLAPDSSVDIPFSVTPYGDSPIEFTVQYQNGINQHEISYTLPVETGKKSRKQADTVLSNVQVNTEKDYYRVTGDVTNSGLETANAVVITSVDPAVPVFPFKVYAVGALKPDDFASFEVTFRADENVTEVPLRASFKDNDGNEFSSDTLVELDSGRGPKPKKDEERFSPLIIGVVGALALGVLGAVWYSRRARG
ncbi:hypothetical protein [Methanospirillum sp.]|uniref:COG1361 S-layer family protein n=2 Tax=Methanospirillum sp. TaxID=45200 RepID=UPI002C4F9DBC|nr:hypothetical protein [Methanospirillum sp.]HOL41442.1 hypothetical protein [Methanospirillum sp.]HPP78171.1 hypothetical protein [Methanospirillum sp.]